ncbi:putative short chain dehydrogenase/reductase [Talaromyces proteolyticus]|uniref:Short chain dehydrogenase/reductase n=1 Tax=Talaromyces proteolyticus TaxID=1131652 RepID=A0AAD4KJ32_9EURO|nr:putative short chain dehydrogenase/reductase [Talaromyces proteolyticus]KAH8692824.1 putative short chain dehydrogenase/reductase [Talaromyces proteolyticus]
MAAKQIVTLITGANQGIGFETAKNLVLSSNAYHVIIGSRDANRGTKAVSELQSLADIKGTLDTVQIDVTDDNSVDRAAEHIQSKYGRLDILVNNAGVNNLNPAVRESMRSIYAVNVIGVASVTEAFLPLLRKSDAPRVVFVSSSMGSIAYASDKNSPYYRPQGIPYRSSKAALNMMIAMYSHSLSLEEKDFKVFGADPGLNATNLVGDAASLRARGAVEPYVGGGIIAAVAKGERDADVGRVCSIDGVVEW